MFTQQQAGAPQSRPDDRLYWGISDKIFFDGMKDGGGIEVCFLDGRTVAGRLRGVSRYNLTLELASGELLLVFKTAIAWARAANVKEAPKAVPP